MYSCSTTSSPSVNSPLSSLSVNFFLSVVAGGGIGTVSLLPCTRFFALLGVLYFLCCCFVASISYPVKNSLMFSPRFAPFTPYLGPSSDQLTFSRAPHNLASSKSCSLSMCKFSLHIPLRRFFVRGCSWSVRLSVLFGVVARPLACLILSHFLQLILFDGLWLGHPFLYLCSSLFHSVFFVSLVVLLALVGLWTSLDLGVSTRTFFTGFEK